MQMILASASPRRIELLHQFGIDFKSVPAAIDESVSLDADPAETVMSLAFQKAFAVAKDHSDALVIASDTVVHLDRIFGKPHSENEARLMLRALSGRVHDVYTGVALVCIETRQKIVSYSRTQVRFKALFEADIERYLDTGEPFDKAGAYGIQGYGALLVEGIVGDYYNVMGLPLSHLNALLEEHFDVSLMTERTPIHDQSTSKL